MIIPTNDKLGTNFAINYIFAINGVTTKAEANYDFSLESNQSYTSLVNMPAVSDMPTEEVEEDAGIVPDDTGDALQEQPREEIIPITVDFDTDVIAKVAPGLLNGPRNLSLTKAQQEALLSFIMNIGKNATVKVNKLYTQQ